MAELIVEPDEGEPELSLEPPDDDPLGFGAVVSLFCVLVEVGALSVVVGVVVVGVVVALGVVVVGVVVALGVVAGVLVVVDGVAAAYAMFDAVEAVLA